MTPPTEIASLNTDPRTLDDTRSLEQKLAELDDLIRPLGRVLVAYSGGVDSAMLVVAAHRLLGDDVIAVTADSESYATGELERAAKILEPFGIAHAVVRTHELGNPEYASNPVNRCYFCKQELFTQLQRIAAERGANCILYGQNADDVGDFRPGSDAARELGARAPLQEAGLTKQDVRDLARQWGVPVWNRPATACLSSRFPYGTPVTSQGLRMVDRAEGYLRGIGFGQLRVRHHRDVARIELLAEDLPVLLTDAEKRDTLVTVLTEIGYTFVTLDLQGFRSGSLNESTCRVHGNGRSVAERAVVLAGELGLGRIETEARDQVLRLCLADDGFGPLADPAPRSRLVQELAGPDARYVALDLKPLG